MNNDSGFISSPFSELPAALVEEILEKTSIVGDTLLEVFKGLKSDRVGMRQSLDDACLLRNESELGYPILPTTCGTDGSYAMERLLSYDLVAAAAVAVEGLTPPSETRHWDYPRHKSFVAPEVHNEDTATILRAVMLGNELLLAKQAPHDVVMLDMTLTLPIIYFNQALNTAPRASSLQCSMEFLDHCHEYLEAYATILGSRRSDKSFIGIPKHSSRREIGSRMNWGTQHDDRGLLTLLLRAGEFTRPTQLDPPQSTWHFSLGAFPDDLRMKATADRIISLLDDIRVFYYKPHPWLPALRIEVAHEVANNDHRLATVIHGVKFQCATAAMLEPYPLYLADRTVKSLARAIPAFRQIATQRVAEKYDGDIGEVFFSMHGYRSESGGS